MPAKCPKQRAATAKRASAAYYVKNKDAVMARAKIAKQTAAEKWREYKATQCCAHCGSTHPASLEFHHIVRSPDNMKLHKLISHGAWAKAMREIKKCVPLCSNCHRLGHWLERNPDQIPNYPDLAKYFEFFTSTRLSEPASPPDAEQPDPRP